MTLIDDNVAFNKKLALTTCDLQTIDIIRHKFHPSFIANVNYATES